jgi:hypothetical protein
MKIIVSGGDFDLCSISLEIEHLKNLKSKFVIQYFETFGTDPTYIITELCPVRLIIKILSFF